MIFDEVWHIRRELRQTRKFYDKGIKKLRAKKDFKKAGEWAEEKTSMLHDIQLRLDLADGNALVRTARSLRVPVPSYQDTKAWENHFGFYVLTDQGYDVLREKIRQETKRRSESSAYYFRTVIVPIIATAISIISIIIAVLSYRRH
jgi:hypothetical protein